MFRFRAGVWTEISGGDLRIDATKYVFSAEMATDGTNLYVAWAELNGIFGGDGLWHVKKYNGSTWVELGTGQSHAGGSTVPGLFMVMFGGQPTVTWIEGVTPHVYVQTWNGSAWVDVGSQPIDTSGSPDQGTWTSVGGAAPITAVANGSELLVIWTDIWANGNSLYTRLYSSGSWGSQASVPATDAVFGPQATDRVGLPYATSDGTTVYIGVEGGNSADTIVAVTWASPGSFFAYPAAYPVNKPTPFIPFGGFTIAPGLLAGIPICVAEKSGSTGANPPWDFVFLSYQSGVWTETELHTSSDQTVVPRIFFESPTSMLASFFWLDVASTQPEFEVYRIAVPAGPTLEGEYRVT